MGEEYICKIPDCKCGGRKGRSELEEENTTLNIRVAESIVALGKSEKWAKRHLDELLLARAENAELHKLLSNHDRHWRKIADAIGTDGGYGGVDGKDGDRWGNAECVIRRVNAIKEVATEAASVVKRAGRRPDGTAWANLNINDLAAKVAALGAVESK